MKGSHWGKPKMTSKVSLAGPTRRQWIGASLLGAVTAAAGGPLQAQSPQSAAARDGKPRGSIIDTHIHLWKLPRSGPPMSDSGTYPTIRSAPWMEMDRLIPDYNATVGGPKVTKVVLIESSVGVPTDKLTQSNLWMLKTAAAESKILGVMGKLDVSLPPDSFGEQMSMYASHKQCVGLRAGGFFQQGAPRSFSSIKPNVIPNLTYLAKLGLRVDALGTPGAILAQIGAAVPGLILVMEHFGGKPQTFDIEEPWKSDMQAAATCPNVYLKTSDVHKLSAQAALGHPADETHQFKPIADPSRYFPVLEFLVKTFGADRLMFGTNWPVSDAGGLNTDTIDLQVNIFESFLSGQPSGSRDKVMYQNAARVYAPRK
jgi:L-fuconolactonase